MKENRIRYPLGEGKKSPRFCLYALLLCTVYRLAHNNLALNVGFRFREKGEQSSEGY